MGDLAETIKVPSIVPTLKRNITVKFKLNEFQTIAQVYQDHITIEAIKNDLSQKFKADQKHFNILQNNVVLANTLRLSDLQFNNSYIIEFELELNTVAKEHNKTCIPSEKIELNADIFYRYFCLPL